MSWFVYGEHTKKHIGVWLRYHSNEDVIELVKKSKLKRKFETVERVIISEYDKDVNQVWLQIWCKNTIDVIRKKNRYNVFHIKTDVNPKWVCEGDLGAGMKF